MTAEPLAPRPVPRPSALTAALDSALTEAEEGWSFPGARRWWVTTKDDGIELHTQWAPHVSTPLLRSTRVAAGTALLAVRLAVAVSGTRPVTTLLPGGRARGLLAIVRCGTVRGPAGSTVHSQAPSASALGGDAGGSRERREGAPIPATVGVPTFCRCHPPLPPGTQVTGLVDQRILGGVRLGIADHLGWAVAVTASPGYGVVDRRRIALIEPGMPAAPIECSRLDLVATVALVAQVRASVVRAASAALDELATALPEPIVSMSLRAWPLDFPEDIAVQRRAPYNARADGVMYRQVLAELAHARDWEVHLYNAKDVVGQAVSMLADRADEVLHGLRMTMGSPWTKDHRMALAATIVAGSATRPSR